MNDRTAITKCGGTGFRWGERTYVMGIVNLSADSFSGDGTADPELATARVQQLVSEGADIVDIGGESTRPGASPIPVDEEVRRVIPVIERVVSQLSVPVSVDTYK